MIKWLSEIVQNADILVVIFTLITVIIGSVKNWFVAENNLKISYYLMMSLGVSYVFFYTYMSSRGNGQEIVVLMNVPSVWIFLMGIKGLRRLKREKNETG